MKYHIFIKWLAILYMYELMILAGVSFYLSDNTPVFALFFQRTGIELTSIEFALLSFIGAALVPMIIFIHNRDYIRRSYYVFCGLPLAFYTVPYAIWLLDSHNFSLILAVYINIYLSFIIIAGATFRSLR